MTEANEAMPRSMTLSMDVNVREIEDGLLLSISNNYSYPGKTWYYPDIPTLLMDVTSKLLQEWHEAKRGPQVDPGSTIGGGIKLCGEDVQTPDTFGGEPTYSAYDELQGKPEPIKSDAYALYDAIQAKSFNYAGYRDQLAANALGPVYPHSMRHPMDTPAMVAAIKHNRS